MSGSATPTLSSRSSRRRPGAASSPVLAGALVGALLLAAAGEPARAQFSPYQSILADFDARVAAEVAEDRGGAVSVAVFRADEVIWSKGWGWADIEKGRPATARTIGRTGSISKSFTAVLLMQLVERGVVGLDEPVVDYLPELADLAEPPGGAEDIRRITFRRLASHTAGLVREPDLEGAASGSIYMWTDKILASIPRTGFRTAPGTEYAYSNIGFGILGYALERASGVPFMELMETQVFGPLGMESSTFILDDPELWSRMSVGYSRDRETGRISAERATAEHFGRGYKVPNGGIYSTVGDLARFAGALMGYGPAPLLDEETVREMLTPQPQAGGYGLGFSIEEQDGVRLVGHGGSVAGYNAGLVFDPETGLGVAMLRTTSFNPDLDALLVALVEAGAEAEAGAGAGAYPPL